MDPVSTIISIAISAAFFVLGVIFNEKLIGFFVGRLSAFGLQRDGSITGEWVSEFVIDKDGERKVYREVVSLKSHFGVIFGFNVSSVLNYPDLNKLTLDQKILSKVRIRAELSLGQYITGKWYHPDSMERYHGSFQLRIEPSFRRMFGMWTGFSDSSSNVYAGNWIWIRLEDYKDGNEHERRNLTSIST